MRLLKLALVGGLVLFTLLLVAVAALLWPPPRGVDLAGGVRLVYEVPSTPPEMADDDGAASSDINWPPVLEAVRNRANPGGGGDVAVRKLGSRQIEIVLSSADPALPERVKQLLNAAGRLEFRVVANRTDDGALVQQAEQQALDSERCKSPYVRLAGRSAGLWAHVGRESRETAGGIRPLKVNVMSAVLRNAATGQVLSLPEDLWHGGEHALELWLKQSGIEQVDVLLVTGDGFDVTGDYLTRISRGYDELGQPCVLFELDSQGAALMAGLTSISLPDEKQGTYRLLGIVLDRTLLSAPRVMSTISDRGRITGQFTREEVDFIVGVLEAGTLPVDLGGAPVAEESFGPNPARRQTVFAIAGATLGVLATIGTLMLVRYRALGLAAAWCSLLQMLLVLISIEVARLPVTRLTVLAAAAMLLVGAVGNAWICEWVHRGTRPDDARPGQWARTLGLSAATLAALLVSLWLISGYAYHALDGELRQAAAVANLGSLAAAATSCLCLPLVILISAFSPPAATREAPVVLAEVVGSDTSSPR